jgi:hypothetical protein
MRRSKLCGSTRPLGRELMFGLLLGIAGMLQPVAALADDLADCTQSSDMPRAIRGCTRLLEASAPPHHSAAIAHRNRSSAYAALGDFERAEQDYHSAVALNPSYPTSARDSAAAIYDRADAGSRPAR